MEKRSRNTLIIIIIIIIVIIYNSYKRCSILNVGFYGSIDGTG